MASKKQEKGITDKIKKQEKGMPGFTEDDSIELPTIPITPNLAPIEDMVLAKNNQIDQETQQIGITTSHEDEIENIEHHWAIKKQEKGITIKIKKQEKDITVKRMVNLRSKQVDNTQPITITADITNTVSASANSPDLCKQTHQIDSEKMELESRFNIKPVKVVLKSMSDKQIQSIIKAKAMITIKKDTVFPRNATKQAKDIYTPAVLRKVSIGKTARFMFSTYRLPSKVRHKYKLNVL